MRVPKTPLAALKVIKFSLSRQGGAGVQAGADGVRAVRRVGKAVLLAPCGHFVVGFIGRSGNADLASHY